MLAARCNWGPRVPGRRCCLSTSSPNGQELDLTHPPTRAISAGMSSGLASTPDPGRFCGATAAMRLLAQETRVTPGRLPRELGGRPILADTSCLDGDSYVLRTDNGLGFFYRQGEGITVDHDPGADLSEESLWLNGSVYAAIACINGLMPIHASAVIHAGRVHAFTGPSGAGKSTLIAALARYGLPMYADDTLVLDLSDPAQIVCLPGHKRLKLTPEAIALTGAQALESVGVTGGKFYARPAPAAMAMPVPPPGPLPLAELIFLETGEPLAMTPITGGARIARLGDDHYTTDLFMRAHNRGRGEMFALRARLARQVSMSCLMRPRDLAQFAASVALAARHIDDQENVA